MNRKACIAEFIGTFPLAFIGVGAIAAMNPARFMGPALLGGGLHHAWLYWVGPIIGGVLGAVIYNRFLEND